MRTLKALIARLAGAPLAWRLDPAAVRRRSGHASGFHPETLPSPPRARTTKQRDGDEGEAIARRYLERAGLVFVAANVRFRDGEIDLVMRDLELRGLVQRDLVKRALLMRAPLMRRRQPSRAGAGVLVFVEVRRRARDSHGGAAASITREKRRRVVAAASHYLVGLGLRALPACRFDVVTIEGDAGRGLRVDWIRDAFRDDG